jgi:YbgC/YbaW family acyl-CoA thioester hydrolase
MPYEFKLTRRIEFAETDMAGIVHFSNFFRMMEMTEHAFFRSLGFSIHAEFDGEMVGWPRVSTSCDFARPLRFEDEVEIQLLVAEVRTRSMCYQFTFFHPEKRVDVAYGSSVAVCATIERASGKLTPRSIPGALRAQISAAPPELIKNRVSLSQSQPTKG